MDLFSRNKNRGLALNDVADYIDTFFKRTSRHSYLGGLRPEQFEATQKARRQSVHEILETPMF